jgi:TRAP-type C4-dicarboxylate transport system permease small subunit
VRERLAARLYRPAALLGGAILVAVLLLTVLDVVLRRTRGAAVPGVFELTELAMAAIAFLGLAQAQQRGEHIAIDLLYERLPPAGRRGLDGLGHLVSLLVAGAVAWQLLVHLHRVRAGGEVTAVLGLPVYPAVALAAAGFGLFALALLADLVAVLAGPPVAPGRGGEAQGRGA